jgi:hypothetical protein
LIYTITIYAENIDFSTSSNPKTLYVPVDSQASSDSLTTTSDETFTSLTNKISGGCNIILVYENINFYLNEQNDTQLIFSNNSYWLQKSISWDNTNTISYEEAELVNEELGRV